MQKPIDASGSYLPREGPQATFRGARELAATIATSRDAQEAFVQQLFHALVKQPMRAWGPDTLETLRKQFVTNNCDIRRLLVDLYGEEQGREVRIIYGGSVKPDNAAEIFAVPEVGGALVGGASLTADSFMGIALAAGEPSDL